MIISWCTPTNPSRSLRARGPATLSDASRSIWPTERIKGLLVTSTFNNVRSRLSSPVLILHFLLNVRQIFRRYITLQVLGQGFRRRFQILLVLLEDQGLIILSKIVGKHVSAHECLTTLAENVHSFLQKLDLQLEVKARHTIRSIDFWEVVIRKSSMWR